MYILGIETSCDETAAAILEDGRKILSNVIASQVDIHGEYGGVVPELASRAHIKSISYVVDKAFRDAGLSYQDISGLAVTQGPGLIGSLLVGVSFAKSMAYALNLPLVGVNHIEGHIYSAFLDHDDIRRPLLALVVSGGHTALYFSSEPERYQLIGRTRDDAAGEAFDKVAKLLGLGYPGGPVIDRLAEGGDPNAVKFSIPRCTDGSLDFSFSGLKTAVLRYVQRQRIKPLGSEAEKPSQQMLDLIASFQQVVIATLLDRTERAAETLNPLAILLVGGVACNRRLREEFKKRFEGRGIPVYYPRPILTTDNAAMIAAAGYPKLLRLIERARDGSAAGPLFPLDLNADANLKLA